MGTCCTRYFHPSLHPHLKRASKQIGASETPERKGGGKSPPESYTKNVKKDLRTFRVKVCSGVGDGSGTESHVMKNLCIENVSVTS